MKVFMVSYDPYQLRRELVVTDSLSEAKLLVEKDPEQKYPCVELARREVNRVIFYFYNAKKSLDNYQETEASSKLSDAIDYLLVFDISKAVDLVWSAYDQASTEKQIIIDDMVQKVINILPVQFTFEQSIDLCFLGATCKVSDDR